MEESSDLCGHEVGEWLSSCLKLLSEEFHALMASLGDPKPI